MFFIILYHSRLGQKDNDCHDDLSLGLSNSPTPFVLYNLSRSLCLFLLTSSGNMTGMDKVLKSSREVLHQTCKVSSTGRLQSGVHIINMSKASFCSLSPLSTFHRNNKSRNSHTVHFPRFFFELKVVSRLVLWVRECVIKPEDLSPASGMGHVVEGEN